MYASKKLVVFEPLNYRLLLHVGLSKDLFDQDLFEVGNVLLFILKWMELLLKHGSLTGQ